MREFKKALPNLIMFHDGDSEIEGQARRGENSIPSSLY
jgi:hypothetical protein